jgi:subtilisin-like proprotein convertase family protein
VDTCGTGNYSTAFSFTTANIACGTYTSTDVPKTISSSGTPTVLSTLTVPAQCGNIVDVNVKNLNISHTWIDDLTIEVISPSGTVVRVMDRPCDDQDNILINFDDEAATSTYPCPPTNNGTYIPLNPLSAFDGQSATGTWTLRVIDNVTQDGGTLNAWSLEICYADQKVTCYRDLDNDSYGDPNNSQTFCMTCGAGYVSDNTDCNDNSSNVNPAGIEICNGIDDNCNLQTDEGNVCTQDPCYSLVIGASPFQDSLWTVDTTTYLVVDRKSPKLTGFTVTGITGFTRHPGTGVYYAVVKISGSNTRRLCTYDLNTDQLALIGDLGDRFSSITFSSGGQLFGVTGNGAIVPETLFDIDPATAATTVLTPLGNGADGEIISYNPDDNMLYHWSGNGTVVFEKILPVAPYTVTPIPIIGTPSGETFGAVYKGNGKFLISNISSSFNNVTTGGQWSAAFGSNPDDLRGLAFTDPLGPNTVTCYLDEDNDTYGDVNFPRVFCDVCGMGYVDNSDDCDDSNGAINPAAIEICDGIDNNCDGQVDESGNINLPPNGSSTVACPALATQPTPPTVVVCGVNVPPTGPVITNNPNPLTCEGTRTYTWTYTSGPNSATWSYVYTIERNDFSVPANGASTVACPALAVAPTLPTVMSNCGETLTPTGPVITNNPNPLSCEGTRTYAYTYTDCEGNSHVWSYVYTIERNPFTVPANGSATVACPAAAVAPTLPTVTSNCGEVLTPIGPVITNNPNPLSCEGTRTYAYTYTDCEGNTATWSFVYTIERNPFTVPANGSATVSCVGQAVAPTLPTVLSNCGEVLTPTGPVITNTPNPIDCAGTRVYAYTYTDCEGNTATWSFTYTIVPQPFSVPANGTATVACPSQTNVQPVPPVVTNACGQVITPVLTNVSAPLTCEGTRVYTWTYKDCAGNTANWTFTYIVEYQDFVVPASETVTVECPLSIESIVPPVVFDNCGNQLNPSGPVITSQNNDYGCEGIRTYTWTYKDCEGNTHTWSKTFNFLYSADFYVYPDVYDVVGCLDYAQPPVPPTIYDICGREIVPSGPTLTEEVNATGCSGIRTYTYVYTDCGGHSHPWVFTYYINDDQPPVGNCPTGSGSADSPSVNVTNLSCIEDVPCPTSYDFTSKIQQLLAAGGFYDICSGHNLVVTLDSWSALWDCSDPDGDGNYTFGRTFYFRIADQCGNEFPELCGVTYSGACQPLNTFTALGWGLESEDPYESGINLQMIQLLLNNFGPLKIGGGLRSLTLTEAQCVADLLPGIGAPAVLGNCNQTNCVGGCNPTGPGGMKNTLAANTIAFMLNVRYNIQYNGLSMAGILSQSLGCIKIDPSLKTCNGGVCQLHVFDQSGVEHLYPYTLGGLLDLTNYFLGGNMSFSDGASGVYATALNNAMSTVNGTWNGQPSQPSCDPNPGATGSDLTDKALPTGKTTGKAVEFSLSPNPTSREVTLKLSEMTESQAVTIDIYNNVGQLLLHKEFGNVSFLNERIDLKGFGNGLYIVSLKAGTERFQQKLVINND